MSIVAIGTAPQVVRSNNQVNFQGKDNKSHAGRNVGLGIAGLGVCYQAYNACKKGVNWKNLGIILPITAATHILSGMFVDKKYNDKGTSQLKTGAALGAIVGPALLIFQDIVRGGGKTSFKGAGFKASAITLAVLSTLSALGGLMLGGITKLCAKKTNNK